MAIPLRDDFDAAALRGSARRTKDAAQARRLLALAAVYNGATRTEAARIGGVTLQSIHSAKLSITHSLAVLRSPSRARCRRGGRARARGR
jgi:hypothetical protein